MALVGGAAAPPLRHAQSESRLHARQRAGSAVLGMPGLNSCSSAADCGLQHVDKKVLVELSTSKAVAESAAKGLLAALAVKPGARENTGDACSKHRLKRNDGRKGDLSCLQEQSVSGHNAAPQVLVAGTGNESQTTLPPLTEVGRGSVRLGSPLQNALRPAKRSRSTSGLHSAQKQEGRQSPQTSPLQTRSKSGFLPELPSSKSDIDIEHVLVTALDGKSGVHKAPLKQCSSMETEAHLEKLMNLLDGEESKHSSPGKKGRHRASISDGHGDNENGIVRKGTGFVHLSSPLEKAEGFRARIDDQHGDNENRIHRKGTGFVHLSHLEGRHARIVDDHGDNENGLHRKGTGFVHISSSSKPGKEHRARINDSHGDNENGIHRQGTGFINLSSLPKESPSVSFPASVDENVNHIQRQGTGFVFLKHVAPRVRIVDSHGDNENRLQRKGTGFVNLKDCDYDLRPSSPGSCSTRTVDSHGPCQDGSDTDVASDECDIADASEEQMSVTDLE